MFFKKTKRFKEKIKGIFDDWTIDECHLRYKKYSLWIANGFCYFRDENCQYFLKFFNRQERKLLWKEARRLRKKFIKEQREEKRKEIFKKFTLKK